jgi:hypothetical protein
MQVNNSEMILIMEMKHYSKMLLFLEMILNLRYNTDYKQISRTGEQLTRILIWLKH